MNTVSPIPAASPLAVTSAAAPVPQSSVPAGATSDVSGGGGFRLGGLPLKEMLLFGTAGAILGMVFPMIPGGPIGGAAIGAGLALLF